MGLLYIGIAGTVLAIDRASGKEVWRVKLKGDFVNVTLDREGLFAAAHGELYCLDPATGDVRWHNPLKGMGYGMVTFATAGNSQVVAHKKQDEEDAVAAAPTSSSM